MAECAKECEADDKKSSLLLEKHARFLRRTLLVLPECMEAYDSSRMTLAFFALSGLDVLSQDAMLEELAESTLGWIRSLYVHDAASGRAGFHGSNILRTANGNHLHSDTHVGHVAMTYTALSCLRILGKWKSAMAWLNQDALLREVRHLQQPNGSFASSSEGGECDMRFVFCAAAVCRLLLGQDASEETLAQTIDVDGVVRFILSSVTHEGGIGQGPGLEAHGGSTFCAVASLVLLKRNPQAVLGSQRAKRLVRWCVQRLQLGFTGRPNKPPDTCYTFWLGATLVMLRSFDNVEEFVGLSTDFVLRTQDDLIGGLAKWADNSTDSLHTYLGLSGLALAGHQGLRQVDPSVNITSRAVHAMQL